MLREGAIINASLAYGLATRPGLWVRHQQDKQTLLHSPKARLHSAEAATTLRRLTTGCDALLHRAGAAAAGVVTTPDGREICPST